MKFKLSGQAEFWIGFASVLCMICVFVANVIPSTVPTMVKSEVSAPQVTVASQPQNAAQGHEPAQTSAPEPPAEDDTPAAPAVTAAQTTAQTTASSAAQQVTQVSQVSQTPQVSQTSQTSQVSQTPQVATTAHTEAPAESEPENGLININTATLDELMQLDGIGEVKGRAIIAYREEHGSFASVSELLNVKGIGEKTLEKLRDNVTV